VNIVGRRPVMTEAGGFPLTTGRGAEG
jgi:hypothetical protein